ncbi:DegT/DnrJ/EryC1/StrS family aminotransferase [Larkinella terrae]|uniref:Aminotransferase class V-fold PLP-dependent enzyme n=1 Tax=Larkinella terrae TaxID=2025311 RepID=A0A7K0EUA3_9BACT|nr:DegT/DnrJ/EryC1/StrS family aminotransferase [Larkinella terrae]MRS65393.1 aminotransferase class V-fold PLP-dependent enzyme [Larkinella terrae]
MINITKSYLPPLEEYVKYLEGIWERVYLTNNGPLVRQLEKDLKNYLGIENLLYCSNGTIVLQMAIKALGLTKEIITTPFSYCASSNVILWESCTPVFADILPDDFTIDPAKIERLITEDTEAILATHVYGNMCRVEEIEAIAQKHKLKVIYDGAHTFGTVYNGQSALSYGDISTCSFHATKVFHTVEGGLVTCKDPVVAEKLSQYRSFGHRFDEYFDFGINGKNSEIHAAMGLCNLPRVPDLIAARKYRFGLYDTQLDLSKLERPNLRPGVDYNYAYYPVVFETEEKLLAVKAELETLDIFPRRYFYPSLNKLPFLKNYQPCPVSEDIALRVLCLPMYPDLEIEIIDTICKVVNQHVN